MKEKEKEQSQDYAKKSFEYVANTYDKIPFFKLSASHVLDIIKEHTSRNTLTVLDVACGTGNVVLACAAQMKESSFDAIDISEGMLAKAKENALENKLDNINFQLEDVTKLDSDKKYHIITCSYAMFFLPEAPRVLQNLVARLRPRGIVIFTSFTAQAFSPSDEILLPILEKYGSKTAKEYDMEKWENLRHKKDIERLCILSYVTDMQIQTQEIRYGMSIDEWWELLNNTGYKGMLMELSADDYEHVKLEYYEAMLKHANKDGEVELVADSYFVVVKK